MKKGTTVALSIGAGVAVIFGVLGCLYGFNKNVHSWVDSKIHPDSTTTTTTKSAYSISVTPSEKTLERETSADLPSTVFVVKALKYGNETVDKRFDYNVDASKEGFTEKYTLAFDKDHIKEETNAASQLAGYSYGTGATLTLTYPAIDTAKWSGYTTIHFYLLGETSVTADLKITYAVKAAAATSSAATSSAAA